MSLQTWHETLTRSSTDGPTLTALARASCIPVADRIVLPNYYFYIGRVLTLTLSGRYSQPAVGSSIQFDICLGAAGTTIVFDTGLFVIASQVRTNVPWKLEVALTCRSVGAGTGTTFFPMAALTSPAIQIGVNSGGFVLYLPSTAPAVGAGFDNTVASALDVFYTPSTANQSLTVHNYRVDVLN